MPLQWNAYSLILVLAAAASLAVASLAWRHRRERGGAEFAALMTGGAIWAGGDAVQLLSVDLGTKLLFHAVAFAGTNLVVVALVAFAFAYAGRHRWATRRNAALLGIPAAFLVVVAAPANVLGLHDLLWADVGLGRSGSLVVMDLTFGPLDTATTVYHYLLVGTAVALFALMAVHGTGRTKKQGVALVFGTLFPLLVNFLWVTEVTRFDFTAAAFTVTGVVFGLAILRYGLLDVVPVARNALLEDLEDGYLVVDERDRVVDLNATARGLAETDLPVGQPLEAAFPEVAAVLATTDPGGSAREEVSIEGEGVRHFEVRVDPLVRNQFRGRLLFLRDITARRAIERRYRALIENASDLIAVLDGAGRLTYLSPSASPILGYGTDELSGRSAFDLVHPEDLDRVREEFEAIVAGNADATAMEFRAQRADGEWIWLEAYGKDLLDEPAVEGVVVNAREVTQRRRREQELEQKNERLEEFASVVSHDLRNPLNVAQARVKMAVKSGGTDGLDAADEALHRMNVLIDDLLSLAREGEGAGEAETVSLEATAREAWENVDTADADLSIETDGRVEADRARLCQLFENLFRNSVEHATPRRRDGPRPGDGEEAGAGDRPAGPDGDRQSSEGAVSVRVGALDDREPGSDDPADAPRGFYVEDDGSGIPPEDRERVFERGVSGSADGTGFGLAIVADIAEAHGWSVEVTEGRNGGARFEFEPSRSVPDGPG